MEFEKMILIEEDSFVVTPNVAKASFQISLDRFGYQPFHVSKKYLFPFYAGMILPKHRTWKNDLERTAQRLIQGGIINQRIRHHIPSRFLEESEDGIPAPKPFGMDQFWGEVLLLVGGLVLAALVLIAERNYHECEKPEFISNWKQRKYRRNTKFINVASYY